MVKRKLWLVTNDLINYPPSRTARRGDIVDDIPHETARVWAAEGVIQLHADVDDTGGEAA